MNFKKEPWYKKVNWVGVIIVIGLGYTLWNIASRLYNGGGC